MRAAGEATAAKRLYYSVPPHEALSIISSGKLTHKWTRTIKFRNNADIQNGPDSVRLCFKPDEAIRKSSLLEGEWCLVKKEWHFGSALESISFNDAATYKQFLIATRMLSIPLPPGLATFVGGTRFSAGIFLAKTRVDKYSLHGLEALQQAILTYVDFSTIPSEFWGHIPQIIDALMTARTGFFCGNFPHEKFDKADEALRKIDSGLKGKHFSGKLPDALIEDLMARTADLKDL